MIFNTDTFWIQGNDLHREESYTLVCKTALSHLPDMEEFIQYLIDTRLQGARVHRMMVRIGYTHDMAGVGDYIDDLCLKCSYASGLADPGLPQITGSRYPTKRLALYADDVVKKLYIEWKYLHISNAGVPCEF